MAALPIHLIKGNHDILKDEWYEANGIETSNELQLNNFSFVHDPKYAAACTNPGHYCFSGHLHPGIVVHGAGKQTLRFPCFYFSESLAILPAFSRFTGIAAVAPKPNEHIFAIVENKVVQLQ